MTPNFGRLSLGLGWIGAIALILTTPAPGLAQTPAIPGLQRLITAFNREPEDNRQGRDGVSRPGLGLCLLSLTRDQTIWHRQPLFVWQGFSTIGVRAKADQSTLLWKETATSQDTAVYRVAYAGSALDPGDAYEWLFFISADRPALWVPFQIMEPSAHAAIAADLDTLQTDLEASNADAETVAIARANYFVENSLVADALQELFAVSTPSAELVALQADLVDQYCSDG